MNPIVSVIIANYNSEKYIKDAIESILKQTLQELELIIVDDKSTDNSLSIINSFTEADSRVRAITLNENSGVTYSRQIGLENAVGKYIAILDSDDISAPNRLQEQAEVLEKYPNVVLVASDYGVIDENGRMIKKQKKVQKNSAAIRWYLTFGNCFAHSTIMFRLSTAKEFGGYDLNIKRGLDMEMSSKLLTKGDAFVIPKPLSYWRTYSKSMTKSVDKNELEKNYISSVQNAIVLHLHNNIEFETALAVYYNYKKPALSFQSYIKALEIISIAFEKYSKIYLNENIVFLERAALKHLLRMYERNNKETWWKEGVKEWSKTFTNTIGKKNLYTLIVNHYSSLSSRNIINLLVCKTKGLI